MMVIVLLGGVVPFAHAQSDTTPPTVPTSVSAGILQSGQVYVYWAPSTDDVGVVGYYLYRNGAFVANTPGIPNYTDTPPSGVYYYTISAYDGAGNVSAQSAPTSYVTVVADTTPPSAPTDFSAQPSSSTIALSWTASTDNVAVIGYYVYRNGVKIATSDPITGSTYTDVGLTPGTTYTYSVVAYDAAGNLSNHSASVPVTAIFDVTPPSTPTLLSAKAVSSNEIDLSWHPSTDNIAVAGYTIYRGGDQIGTTASTSYADTGVSPQTSYGYDVVAYDTVGNNSQKASVSATTLPPDITPPSIPGGIAAVALSSSDVMLTWRASTDDIGVSGYYIYRDGNQIGADSAASTSYEDSGLSTSTTYTYAVRAYDAAGNISPQTSAAVTTLSYTPVTVPPVTPAPAPSPAPSPSPSPSPYLPPTSTGSLTVNLYFGLRTGDVSTLQSILIAHGYLGASYGTGFYGSLTQAAVKKFQCAQNIVCSGGPATTGWGSVGPRTRKALNSL